MQQIFSTEAYRAANYKFLDYLSLNSNKLGIGSNVDMDNANIQPYTIRLHAKLVNGQNTYEFRLKGAIAPLSIEKTLADSDIFQGYAMALCLQQYDPTAPDFKSGLWSYPDATQFAAFAPPLELIYAGNTIINTDGTNRLQNFDNHLFRTAPGGPAVYGPSMEERGYYVFPSYPILFGSKSNTITVNLAQGSTTAIANTGANTNNIVILLHGFRFTGISAAGCQV